MRHKGLIDFQNFAIIENQIKAFAFNEREDAVDIGVVGKGHAGVDPGQGHAPVKILRAGISGCGGNIP